MPGVELTLASGAAAAAGLPGTATLEPPAAAAPPAPAPGARASVGLPKSSCFTWWRDGQRQWAAATGGDGLLRLGGTHLRDGVVVDAVSSHRMVRQHCLRITCRAFETR